MVALCLAQLNPSLFIYLSDNSIQSAPLIECHFSFGEIVQYLFRCSEVHICQGSDKIIIFTLAICVAVVLRWLCLDILLIIAFVKTNSVYIICHVNFTIYLSPSLEIPETFHQNSTKCHHHHHSPLNLYSMGKPMYSLLKQFHPSYFYPSRNDLEVIHPECSSGYV